MLIYPSTAHLSGKYGRRLLRHIDTKEEKSLSMHGASGQRPKTSSFFLASFRLATSLARSSSSSAVVQKLFSGFVWCDRRHPLRKKEVLVY